MSPEERHAEVVKAYPGGLTPEQFVRVTLESVDADGKVDPPALDDWFAAMGIVMRMYFDGLIERRGKGPMWNRGGPWYITEKGDAARLAGYVKEPR